MTVRRPPRAAAACAALAWGLLALTACGPGAPPASPTSPATTPGAATGAVPGATHGATASPGEPTPTAPAAPSPDDPACLVGEWTLDQAGLDAFYADVTALGAGSGMTFTPRGSARLSIAADGAFSWHPDAVVTLSVEDLAVDVTLGGAVTGTSAAGRGTIEIETESVDGLTATTSGADPFEAAAIVRGIAGAPLRDATFACGADRVEFVSAVADGYASATLHRR